MSKVLSLAYGIGCYGLFLVTYLYFIGFMGNLIVPNTLDGTPRVSLALSLLNNAALIALFGVQHSVMARPAFKRIWTTFVPQHLERSTYVLFSCAALFALCWFWQPLGGTIWYVEYPLLRNTLYGIFAIGWLMVPMASMLINHFDLFGVRQVWLYFRGKPYEPLAFRTPGPYRFVRHPLYIGWLLVNAGYDPRALVHGDGIDGLYPNSDSIRGAGSGNVSWRAVRRIS
jgi:protein-S-isoprenylcysteine O-methyltransferase Ste14